MLNNKWEKKGKNQVKQGKRKKSWQNDKKNTENLDEESKKEDQVAALWASSYWRLNSQTAWSQLLGSHFNKVIAQIIFFNISLTSVPHAVWCAIAFLLSCKFFLIQNTSTVLWDYLNTHTQKKSFHKTYQNSVPSTSSELLALWLTQDIFTAPQSVVWRNEAYAMHLVLACSFSLLPSAASYKHN